jgi:hypothetical protein
MPDDPDETAHGISVDQEDLIQPEWEVTSVKHFLAANFAKHCLRILHRLNVSDNLVITVYRGGVRRPLIYFFASQLIYQRILLVRKPLTFILHLN